VNKQIISTIITWLFLLPIIWFGYSTGITKNTPLNKIEGVISKIECKQKSKRLNGKLYIYYEENKRNISFWSEYLNRENFDKGCIELSKLIKIGSKFTAITTDNVDQVIEVIVGSNTFLEAKEEIIKINNNNNIQIIIFLFMGGVLTLGNVIIWFYKLNPDNWVKSSFFQGMLYFIAIMAIIGYLLD